MHQRPWKTVLGKGFSRRKAGRLLAGSGQPRGVRTAATHADYRGMGSTVSAVYLVMKPSSPMSAIAGKVAADPDDENFKFLAQVDHKIDREIHEMEASA